MYITRISLGCHAVLSRSDTLPVGPFTRLSLDSERAGGRCLACGTGLLWIKHVKTKRKKANMNKTN